jgi:hypothetical protein
MRTERACWMGTPRDGKGRPRTACREGRRALTCRFTRSRTPRPLRGGAHPAEEHNTLPAGSGSDDVAEGHLREGSSSHSSSAPIQCSPVLAGLAIHGSTARGPLPVVAPAHQDRDTLLLF